jgi:hypothetical protein
MVNGLAQERSAYLRQHWTNPVNWLPWSEAALSAANSLFVGQRGREYCRHFGGEPLISAIPAAQIPCC